MSVSGSAQVTIGSSSTLEPIGATLIAAGPYNDDPALLGTTCGPTGMTTGVRSVPTKTMNGLLHLVSDSASPVSPPGVWDVTFNTGIAVKDSLGGWSTWSTCARPRTGYRQLYVREYLNFWGNGSGNFEAIHSGGIKLWFFNSAKADTTANINIFSWGYIDGSGPPAVVPSARFTFAPAVWNTDGSLLTNAGVFWKSALAYPATAWHKVETLLTSNSLPGGGSDASPVNNATFQARINGQDVTWINTSTGASGLACTGFRTRTYANPAGVVGIWRGITYGGGQAGVKTRTDHIRWADVHISGTGFGS